MILIFPWEKWELFPIFPNSRISYNTGTALWSHVRCRYHAGPTLLPGPDPLPPSPDHVMGIGKTWSRVFARPSRWVSVDLHLLFWKSNSKTLSWEHSKCTVSRNIDPKIVQRKKDFLYIFSSMKEGRTVSHLVKTWTVAVYFVKFSFPSNLQNNCNANNFPWTNNLKIK